MKKMGQISYHVPKIVLILGAIFLILGLVAALVKNLKLENKSSNPPVIYEYEQYYLVASHFTDEIDSIATSELKNILALSSDQDVFVSFEERDNIKKMLGIDNYQPRVKFAQNQKIIEKLIESNNTLAILPFTAVDSRVKTLRIDDKMLWEKSVIDYPLHLKLQTGDRYRAENEFNKDKITLLTNVGDVILGRYVAHKMKAYNDYTHPWLKMAGLLSKADITFTDLEVPLSDQYLPSDEGMSFIAPSKSIDGLKLAGVDVVALANNHSTNYGTSVFMDTLDLLKKSEIGYVGGGLNYSEAYKPLIIEKNGLKWAFVDYNSITGAINASESSPGVAKFEIKPWVEVDSKEDLAVIKRIISDIKNKVDIVVAEFHWGVEYKSSPIQSQVDIAHEAIESGADLIIGTHPHVVQGMENYKNTPIIYSLGNFIFDQEWSEETKQGVVAETYFYKKKLVNVGLVPYQIEDYNQPRPTSPNESKKILNRIFDESLSPEYK